MSVDGRLIRGEDGTVASGEFPPKR